ncbi:MAG: TraB/GumN family protein [Flavisolibacter sp.]|nr:TraB/GumN family protein [Flavisolibacter sp.]
MRNLTAFAILFFSFSVSYSQQTKIPPKNYPSLLWEITGKGLNKPSYLFGTMHVSSKMVFNLSDSFYLGIKNADVVALETDMGTWQDDFSRYDLDGSGYNFDYNLRRGADGPGDYLTIGTLQFPPYEKLIEMALYSSPAMINSFLYRTNSDKAVDFEEDTYLDMHIYQTGKKWGKKVCGVENFDQSMELMKQAYIDAAKEKTKKQRSFDYEGDFSYSKLEDAYRTGNLDLLDTINKVNSTSAAFDEKFLYKRNEIQAASIDSIIRTKQSLFVGVGAAHLPGQRGVIEMLRRMGYTLRPIKITERDSKRREELEKVRVPVQFSRQTSKDGLFSVNMPGKLYDFNNAYGIVDQQQFADMSNGAYYMVTRINTNSVLWGHSEDVVLKKIDSVIYENVPGKILSKQPISKNGYKGFEVTNRTRRGDFQRYNIFVTPFEIVLFKMSGNGDYVKEGTEANQFFSSIQFNDYKSEWKKWSPSFGGFEVDMPHEPLVAKKANWQFMAIDQPTNTGFAVIRTDVHNYGFVEEDSFDLALMEESFAASRFIDKQISSKQIKWNGYPALDAKYKYKDGSIALVRFLIQGTHYYTLVAHSKTENAKMNQFLNSFSVKPFKYDAPKQLKDTSFYFTVQSPVALERPKKLSMYPDNASRYGYGYGDDDEALLFEEKINKTKTVVNDSTGEKIFVSFSKPSRYYYREDGISGLDSSYFERGRMKWQFRSQKKYELPNQTKVQEYVIGDDKSSRYVRGKVFTKNGVSYWLQTEGDTLTKPSAFISNFFETFMPADTLKGVNVQEKKTKIFFEDFFSTDTLKHRRAVVNVDKLEFGSADFPLLRRSIQSLSWKERKYMEVKNDFLWKLYNVKSKEAADYLKDVYYAAGDTVEFQYTVLNALLAQKTSYSYQVFKDIMLNEPPILDVDDKTSTYVGGGRGNGGYTYSTYSFNSGRRNFDRNVGENFFDNLSDSLQLTATIFKDLLPLMNIDDYEQPIMELAGTLIDSNMIDAKDYETYLTKFLVEAKQLLKKQRIMEKNKAIEKARKEDNDDSNVYNYSTKNDDSGNSDLSLYATLLMPFYDKNPAVQQFISQLLKSDDNRLKYNTTLLLLRNKKAVPDTMLKYFAALDDYRYELYSDLKEGKLSNLFPSAFSSQVQLAKGRLFEVGSNYNKPDSVVYIDKLPVQFRERKGFVYFFKYRSKRDDNGWKIATVGIVPGDAKQFEFENKDNRERRLYNFTELTNTKINSESALSDQLKKVLKKMLYSKRNSAVQFYKDEDRMRGDYYPAFNVGE